MIRRRYFSMSLTQDWARAEMHGARLDTPRRFPNLIRICEKLAQNAGKSLSAALGNATPQAPSPPLLVPSPPPPPPARRARPGHPPPLPGRPGGGAGDRRAGHGAPRLLHPPRLPGTGTHRLLPRLLGPVCPVGARPAPRPAAPRFAGAAVLGARSRDLWSTPPGAPAPPGREGDPHLGGSRRRRGAGSSPRRAAHSGGSPRSRPLPLPRPPPPTHHPPGGPRFPDATRPILARPRGGTGDPQPPPRPPHPPL